MTWTKLGDEFGAEAAPLTSDAFRTHVEALLWSNFRLLDLEIPKRDLKRFAEAPNPDAAVKELLETGWWTDRGDVWWIGCKFPEWQRDRSQVEHRREQNAEAQRRRRRHEIGDHSLCLRSCRGRASADESADDTPDDPGRVGTGRGGTPTTSTSKSRSNLSTDVGKEAQQQHEAVADDGWSVLKVAVPGEGLDQSTKAPPDYSYLKDQAAEYEAKLKAAS